LLSDLWRHLEQVVTGQTPKLFARSASGDPLISLNPATSALLLDAGILADLDAVQWHRRRGAVFALAGVLRDGDTAARAAAKAALQRRLAQEHNGSVLTELKLLLGASDVLPLASSPVTTNAPSEAEAAKALYDKGHDLQRQYRTQDAIAVYDDVLARFGDVPEAAVRAQAAEALFNKGSILGTFHHTEKKDLTVYDDLLARYGNATEPSIRQWVAHALINKGVRLEALDRKDDAIAVYDDMLARFGADSEESIYEWVAQALVHKGDILRIFTGHIEDAIAVYDDVLARFGSVSSGFTGEQVALALIRKGFALESLGRKEDAIAVYDDVLARYSSYPSIVVEGQVSLVRYKLHKSCRPCENYMP
jgi:tetratricopeptide (TPR) repeat protein